MSDKLYPVSKEWAKRAHVDDASYQAMYAASVNDPEAFWREHGKRIDWFKPYTKVKNTSYKPGKVKIAWFEDGITNVAYNCIDRHLAKRADQVAIIWEGDDPGVSKKITYRELHGEVCRFANVLRLHGVKLLDIARIVGIPLGFAIVVIATSRSSRCGGGGCRRQRQNKGSRALCDRRYIQRR